MLNEPASSKTQVLKRVEARDTSRGHLRVGQGRQLFKLSASTYVASKAQSIDSSRIITMEREKCQTPLSDEEHTLSIIITLFRKKLGNSKDARSINRVK